MARIRVRKKKQRRKVVFRVVLLLLLLFIGRNLVGVDKGRLFFLKACLL